MDEEIARIISEMKDYDIDNPHDDIDFEPVEYNAEYYEYAWYMLHRWDGWD